MRDAEFVEFPPKSLRRVHPRHPEMWVRMGGVWRRGWVEAWVRLPSGQWAAWARRQAGKISADYGWLAYHPDVIRPRDGDKPPQSQ